MTRLACVAARPEDSPYQLAVCGGATHSAPMLVEFHGVKQETGVATQRRWFQDEGMDLIVWYDAAKQPEGYQICYIGEDRRERALTWRAKQGFTHARVDAGDTRPDKNLTPILVKDGVVPWARVQADFSARAAELDPSVRDWVLATLANPN